MKAENPVGKHGHLFTQPHIFKFIFEQYPRWHTMSKHAINIGIRTHTNKIHENHPAILLVIHVE